VATACSKPPAGRARWILELLAGEMVKLTDHLAATAQRLRGPNQVDVHRPRRPLQAGTGLSQVRNRHPGGGAVTMLEPRTAKICPDRPLEPRGRPGQLPTRRAPTRRRLRDRPAGYPARAARYSRRTISSSSAGEVSAAWLS